MSWRTIAIVFVAVFVVATVQAGTIGPLYQAAETINASGNYSNSYYDGNELIMGLPGHWANMGLVAIFGAMTWGAAVVLRRELTRRER